MTTPAEALDKRAGQATVRGLAARQMVCPMTGLALDYRNTVVLRVKPEGKTEFTVSVWHYTFWDRIGPRFMNLANKRGEEYEVLDGRELF